MSQLPTDCLNEIFEYLENDKAALFSCLLVNRLWCEISVRILWRSVWNCSTLIACLPSESKEILCKNGITISTLTSKPPIFNYAAFCKTLSIDQVNYKVEQLLRNQQSISSQNLQYIVAREIFKLLINQIPSLKMLDYSFISIPNISITSYSGAQDCLRNLSELHCRSNIYPEFFYELSTICRNIRTLNIIFGKGISNGLTDLISVQQNLKYLKIIHHGRELVEDILPSVPNTLIKFKLVLYSYRIPFSFMTKFTNLQELVLSFHCILAFEKFKQLQYTTFPQLQILKFNYAYPRYEVLVKFLENNGKNLKELCVGDRGVDNNDILNLAIVDGNDILNLAIAKFCQNLRKLSTGFKIDKLETMKMVFKSCQYLECIKIWCGKYFLNESKALEMFSKYSCKNAYELTLYHIYSVKSGLLPKELESFFISWRNRVPQKSLSLIIVSNDLNSLNGNEENMKIIEKYNKLGVVKFKVIDYDDDDDDDV